MSTQMNTVGEDHEIRVVLTGPTSLEAASSADYKSPNLVKRVLTLLKEIKLTSDLAQLHLHVPATFNLPKSQLQVFGEAVYATRGDLLQKCNKANSPVDRFIAVVAWVISTSRPIIFGAAPYNPILGETHHVSRGSLNVLLEQVSHHPPVSAIHATDDKENIDLTWSIHPVAKFHGNRMEAELTGKRQLKLLNHGETYLMNSPKFLFRIIPPGVDWIGNVKISCQETGFEAELRYNTTSFLGRGGKHSIKGNIYDSSSSRILYQLDGYWNSVVTIRDVNNGKEQTLYDAKEIISDLKAPVVKDLQDISQSESAVVWGEVTEAIQNKNWNKAIDAKKAIEEKQREFLRQRKSRGENWVPKHFTVSHHNGNGYDCLPIQQYVQTAPIVLPL